MSRFNRAQVIAFLIALGAGLIVFGGWVTTQGQTQVHVSVSRAFTVAPARLRQIPGQTGASSAASGPGVSAPILGSGTAGASSGSSASGGISNFVGPGPGFGAGRLGGRGGVVSFGPAGPNFHQGLPLYGDMLIFLALIAIWALAAGYLLRDRRAVVVMHEE